MKFSMEKLHVYTLALIAAILPNIVFLNAIPQPRDSIFFMAFPKGEINYDFFSYSKMMFLIFSSGIAPSRSIVLIAPTHPP